MRIKQRLSRLLLVMCVVSFVTQTFGDEQAIFKEDWLKVFAYRALGPARQSSRILDVAVPESQPYTFYVSTASGGLWKTVNNGTTFTPIFENPGKMPIGDVAVASSNPNIIWVGTGDPASGRVSLLGDGVYKSTDGGKTWTRNVAGGVHVDHHALWIDPQNSDRIILGNDGGLAITYDRGKTWDVYENIPAAQFYAIGVDMEEPYNIYGGTQDTGSVKIPSHGLTGRITGDDWVAVGGGDGMYNQPDPNDSRWLYNEFQFGNIQRLDQKLGIGKPIRPSRKEGEPPLRFNWNTPIHISPHNSQVIYIGSQVLHRSLNRGDDWQEVSPDLTTNDAEKLKGNIEYCVITTISESPLTPGIIWVGTADGKVQLTRNGGGTWADLTPNLGKAGAPEDYYVSRVFASHFEEGTAYAVKTGFQRDDFQPFVFKTTDHGESWTSIASDLQQEIIYVIFEDNKNPNLLFVGTDIGVFVTLDGGKKWMSMKNNMPTNPVHDLLVHPRENDLVVGSYGRGIYVTDISPLQEMNEKALAQVSIFLRLSRKSRGDTGGEGVHSDKGISMPPTNPTGLSSITI